MKVVFRTDASILIGSGHVMRCLTLAQALLEHGHECLFICRDLFGNLNMFIHRQGFAVHCLPVGNELSTELVHAHWLGASLLEDVQACKPILAAWQPDWLIVDHYALDHQWESAVIPPDCRLMAIDDLADRRHECDLLLDQTFGRKSEDYCAWVPEDCQLLCGSQYALLRPEFAALRPYSLQRRAKPLLSKLLITMGGVDKDNATGQVLEALRACSLPAELTITVVMGVTAPWLAEVERLAQRMPWPTKVLVGVSQMAQLMADSDLAIGAAGATSWERCCLGLPTVMLVLAENQRLIARALSCAGAAYMVDLQRLKHEPLISSEQAASEALSAMSLAAASIVDGSGLSKVIEFLEQ